MKKLIKVVFLLMGLVLIALLLIPIFFKDRIKALVIEEFARQTTAELYFGEVGLNLFREFPDLKLRIDQFGVVGTGLFESDTLVAASGLRSTISLKALIQDDRVVIKEMSFDDLSITLIALSTGEVNYDIMREGVETQEEVTGDEQQSLLLALDHFGINNGKFIYFDQGLNMFVDLSQINLTSTLSYQNNTADLQVSGGVESIDLLYEGTSYVSKKSLNLETMIQADLENSTYTFKENRFFINALPFHIDGVFSMLENDDYEMNFEFNSPEATFM